MRPNRFRESLEAGHATIGTRIQSSWPSIVEAIGHTRQFDCVEFLAEYAPFDLYALENLCRAAELHNLTPIIKIAEGQREFLTQRAIGAGFQAVLFAACRSADDVRRCVQLVRPETPQDAGHFGIETQRFAHMRQSGTPEYIQALRDVVVMIMIEKRSAVEQLEEILSVPGLDMIQWGPADYTMSAAMPRDRNNPEVKAIERRVLETALKMGIQPRVELRYPEQVHAYLEMGVRHFNLGVDLSILYEWWKSNGTVLRQKLESAEVDGRQ
ncbi:MAG: 2,4-dihydroxyhept-2-ene-1,7-dioic acid aldolase [Anaerolineae bacterium]|nr:2,4-dihydroxyhept-2-ene-1,7-dioic acid aldolase [Anaerolineae bacterium]